jgi:hypothetical protein
MTMIIHLTPHRGFSVTAITSILRLLILPTKPRLFYLYNNCDITFLTMFILTHPVNRSAQRKPTTFGRALIDSSHESVARIEPANSDVKGTCSDDCATEAPFLVTYKDILRSLPAGAGCIKK